MSLLAAWAPYFSSSERMRGRSYYEAGRVQPLPPQDGDLIRAQVQGQQTHTVTVHRLGGAATAHCTCPQFAEGSFCRHLWAALLAACQGVTPDRTEAAALDQINPRPPKARKRTVEPADAPHDPAFAWSQGLNRIHPSPLATESPPVPNYPLQRRVWYLVNVEWSHRLQSLVIEPRYESMLSHDDRGLRRLKLHPALLHSLAEPIDRELCTALLGAVPLEAGESTALAGISGARSGPLYQVPPAAQRTLLQRMIETDRCALAWPADPALGTRPAPLAWEDAGQPWALWALGRVENNALILDLELRRDGDRMPVDEPDLILGGDDGLVIHRHRAAPFDDRHAYPWINLFRGEGRTLGVETGLTPPRFSAAGVPPGVDGLSPIRVPLEELPQFLDRLYHLPCVPELDLPPEIGPIPQRLVPIPRLQLSEQMDEAAHTRRRRPGSSYLAEAEFNYAGAQVRPMQGGWFIFPPGSEGAEASASPAVELTSGSSGDQPPPRKARAAQPMRAQTDPAAHTLVSPQAPAKDIPSALPPKPAPVRRDIAFERRAMATLLALGLRPAPATGTGSRPPGLLLPAKRMPSVVRELLGQGWVVTIDRRVVRNPGPVHLSVTTGIDWFELRGSVRYTGADGNQDVPLPEILAASRAGKAMISLEDGSCAILPHEWLSENRLLAAVGTQRGDHVGFRHNQAALLEALLTRHPAVEIDAKFEAIRQRLRRFDRIAPLDASPTFHGQLRHYQREGLGWLRFLRWLGVGGILADDMGLGKTIQVLAMLEAHYNRPGPADPAAEPSAASQPLPSLIVVPRSAVFNWVDEARRFAPDLDLLTYTGGDRHALRDAFAHHHVVVTSYGVMRKDIAELQRHRFDYVVLDEAQAIKNPGSQVAKAARLLLANHRLALTGTPVENHLGDLWSIFEFLNPGMLGSGTRFARLIRRMSRRPRLQPLVVSPVPANADTPRPSIATPTVATDPAAVGMAQLTAALRPFILRRTKQQVLQELPDKTEQTILCHMNAPQRQLYDQLLHYYRSLLLGASTTGSDRSIPAGGDRSTMRALEALLRLRQAACHPGLIDPDRAGDRSAKLDELIGRLEPIVEAGHKALVFSQFTSLLTIVRKRLDERQFVYEYLDGQTRNRKQCVERFQTDPDCPVFLISLKAGGLALNLTAAEYVFLLDPWWNPAVEAQAISRAHRIGQTRHVFAYRLICQDTVEQRITQLQARKRDLAEAVIRSDNDLLRNLSRDEMLWLLS